MKILEKTDMGEYVVQKEQHDFDGTGTNMMEIEIAYTQDGKYIGEPSWAAFLTSEGIVPEFRTATSAVCSIGYCQLTEKWYGWSHRAMQGFAVGDEFQSQTIRTVEQAKECAKIFAESVS